MKYHGHIQKHRSEFERDMREMQARQREYSLV